MRRLSNYHCRKIVRAMMMNYIEGGMHLIDEHGDRIDPGKMESWEYRDMYDGQLEIVDVLPDGDQKLVHALLERAQARINRTKQ